MRKVGEGLSCSSKSEVTGTLVYVTKIEDVIELFDTAKGKICLVDDAGITTLGPILSDLSGTICTTGGAGSHLAIISREFGIPCIMGIKISPNEIPSLIDKEVKIAHQGEDKGFLYVES
jgi:phosphoenolpyruvate-protein kinase (PTS system EI component)